MNRFCHLLLSVVGKDFVAVVQRIQNDVFVDQLTVGLEPNFRCFGLVTLGTERQFSLRLFRQRDVVSKKAKN